MARHSRLFNSITSVDQVEQEMHHAGSHFFDPDTKRFFRSRTAPRIFVPLRKDGKARGGFKACSGPIWFVTSEQYNERFPRMYTVRCYNPRGRRGPAVNTVGEFQAHPSLRAAYRAAQLAANARELGR